MESASSSAQEDLPNTLAVADRRGAYLFLVSQIANSLDEKDVHRIVFLCELPEKMKSGTPLEVLELLHKQHGSRFSEWDVQPLVDLLTKIDQQGLISSKVEPYRQKYGGGRPPSHSMPVGAINPRAPMERRPYSYYGQTSSESITQGPPYQETNGHMPSIPDNPRLEQAANNPQEASVPGSQNSSAIDLQSLHLETLNRPVDEQSVNSTPQFMLGETPPQSARTSPPYLRSRHTAPFNYQSSNSLPRPHQYQGSMGFQQSTQSLHQPYDGYNVPRQRYSISTTEVPQYMRHYDGQFNNGMVFAQNRRSSVDEHRPLVMSRASRGTPSDQWYKTSIDSNLERQASSSSGFASSGEIHRRFPPKPSYHFIDFHHSDRRPSQEHSQGSLHHYPMAGYHVSESSAEYRGGFSNGEDRRMCSVNTVPLPPMQLCFDPAYQSTPPHRVQSNPLPREPIFTNQDPRAVYTENKIEREYSSTPFEVERMYHGHMSAGVGNHNSIKQSTQHGTSEAKHYSMSHDTADEASPERQDRFDNEPVAIRARSRDKVGAVPPMLSKVDPNMWQQLDIVQPRLRAYSLDQRASAVSKTKKKKHRRLSLHSEQSSNGTATPPKIQNRHSVHIDAFEESSESSISPSHKPECSIKSVDSFGASKIPKSYRPFSLPRTKTLKPKQELEWKEKLNDINKLIYDEKHVGKFLPCPWKITFEGKDGHPSPKINLRLHPYGIEEDSNRNVTFEVAIEQPKKLRLHSEAKLSIQISARTDKTEKVLGKKDDVIDLKLSFSYLKGFISHERLKESVNLCGNETVIVTVKAEMILPRVPIEC